MDSKLKCLFLLPESNGVDGGNRDSWQSTGIGSGNGDSVTTKVIQYMNWSSNKLKVNLNSNSKIGLIFNDYLTVTGKRRKHSN